MTFQTIIKTLFISIGLFFFSNLAIAQKSDMETQFELEYKKNIRKPRINGVYIPKDLNDVYKELSELSSANALNKFKLGKEEIVAKKLALGIGRWMFVNWNFYEGSRISHLLKTKYGVTHPEDMSTFLIICFHRHLNNKNIDAEKLAQKLVVARVKLLVQQKIIYQKQEN